MGIKSYFVPRAPKTQATNPPRNDSNDEKASTSAGPSALQVPEPSQLSESAQASVHATDVFRSGQTSAFPSGKTSVDSSGHAEQDELANDVLVHYLHQQQKERLWTQHTPGEGIVLKKTRNVFSCCPPELVHNQEGLFAAVERMNVKASTNTLTRFSPYSTLMI